MNLPGVWSCMNLSAVWSCMNLSTVYELVCSVHCMNLPGVWSCMNFPGVWSCMNLSGLDCPQIAGVTSRFTQAQMHAHNTLCHTNKKVRKHTVPDYWAFLSSSVF